MGEEESAGVETAGTGGGDEDETAESAVARRRWRNVRRRNRVGRSRAREWRDAGWCGVVAGLDNEVGAGGQHQIGSGLL